MGVLSRDTRTHYKQTLLTICEYKIMALSEKYEESSEHS